MGYKVLTLDSSSTSTGYSIWIDGKLEKYGVIDLKDYQGSSDGRIKTMILKIYELMNKWHPDIVVTELTVVTRNPQVQRLLTEILGAVMGKCYSDGIKYLSFRPTEWRKLVKNKYEYDKLPRKRDELKQWSLEVVNKKLNIECTIDDVSDAILLGVAYFFGGKRNDN